jgi:hypothetical protein
MEQISKRHHFIPQYFLKGFSNEKNLFYLYKVYQSKIEKNLYSPDSVFFENFRNTIIYNDKESDIIEKIYSHFDNSFALFFNEVKKGVSEEELFSNEVLVCIKQFLALFLCRLPIIDKDIDFLINNLDYSKTRNIIMTNGLNFFNKEDIKKKLAEDKNYRYFFRCFILPILIFDLRAEDNGRWYLFNSVNNKICCDIPILIKDCDLIKLLSFNTDLIFPISSNKLLIHSMNKNVCKDNISELFSIEVDLLLFWNARRYVVCSDKEYLENIKLVQKETEKTISFDNFNAHVFKLLQN